MSYSDEFSTVELILNCGAKTLAVDAFALSLIKAERQARKLFTYLVYQFPAFGPTDKLELRRTLAKSSQVYFQGVIAGLDVLSPIPVKELVGQEYDRLWARFGELSKHRNKIFHGQLTAEGLSRPSILGYVGDIKLWCRRLGKSAEREFGYDGFARNSFRKSMRPDLWRRFSVQINSLEEYTHFIHDRMERRGVKPNPTSPTSA